MGAKLTSFHGRMWKIHTLADRKGLSGVLHLLPDEYSDEWAIKHITALESGWGGSWGEGRDSTVKAPMRVEEIHLKPNIRDQSLRT